MAVLARNFRRRDSNYFRYDMHFWMRGRKVISGPWY